MAEGEDERVLRAVQVVIEEGHRPKWPILIGRPSVVETRLKRFGLSLEIGRDVDLINPEDDPPLPRLRRDLSRDRRAPGHNAGRGAQRWCAPNATVIAALAVQRGDADALICGLEGRFQSNLRHLRNHSSASRRAHATSRRSR